MTAKKKTNSEAMKVLHVTDFELIFEPSDARRKKQRGPLSFTKSLVTTHFLSKDAEIRYFERMRVLKAHDQRHLLRSVYEDVKNWVAGKYLGPRGFLVDADCKPASYTYLANQLDHVPIEDLKIALPILVKIGLFEKVCFDGSPDVAGRGRPRLDGSGRRRKPLNKGKSKDKGKSKNKSRNAIDNGKVKVKEIKNGSGNHIDVNALDRKQKNKAKSTTTTTLSTKPRDPARRGGAKLIEFPTPSPAVFNNRSAPEKLGSVIAGMEHRHSPDCKSFAGEIYESLELSFDPQSSRGRREACCFASLWMKVKKAGINASALEELRIRAIEEARKVARRKLRCGNVSAVWVHIFERLVAARCRGEAV